MLGSSQMRAMLVEKPGPLRSLRMGSAPVLEPAAGEVRVCVHAVGLNPIDWKLITAGHEAWHYPQIPGVDGAGTIEGLGVGVEDLSVGERVLFHADMTRPGSFADFVTLPAETIARIPEGLAFEAAAALPCAGMAAYYALHHRLRAARGQTILVWGASGGVGGFAVQLARIADLRVIAAYSGHDRDYVLGLGADEIIDWRNDDPKRMIAALTSGQGVDAILNVVGSERATADLELLAFGGAIACVAGLPDLGRLKPFTTAPSIHEIALGGLHRFAGPAGRGRLRAMGEELAKLVVNGNIRPMLAETVAFERLPDALAQLQAGAIRGKVVARLRN